MCFYLNQLTRIFLKLLTMCFFHFDWGSSSSGYSWPILFFWLFFYRIANLLMFDISVSSFQTSKVWVYDLSWRQCENVNGHVNKKLRIIIRKKYVFHHSLWRSITQNNWNKQSVKSWLGQACNGVGNVLISQNNLAVEVVAIASMKTIIGIYFCKPISLYNLATNNFTSCLLFFCQNTYLTYINQ